MPREFVASSVEAMGEVAKELASKLALGDVVAFSGELGAGKTTLIKSIVSALTGCDSDAVTSPTFTYVHEYDHIAHFDLYRLNSWDQFLSMDLDTYFSNERICLVEWPEKADGHLPHHKSVTIEHQNTGRRITVDFGGQPT